MVGTLWGGTGRYQCSNNDLGGSMGKMTALLLLGFCVFGGRAEKIVNPELIPMTFGAETPRWRWNSPKTAEGAYEGGTYTLTGNGHGIYQCWDGFAGAFSAEQPSGDFTFTVRIASAPENTTVPRATKVGIFAKATADATTPVIAFHWDYFWENEGKEGLGWFNRLTPSSEINLKDEKGCVADAQGCRGKGYENTVPGFDEKEGLWLRMRREKVGSLPMYYLYARYDNDTGFQKIESVTGPNNPCNSSEPLPPLNLPAFLLPEVPDDGAIFFGVYVAGADHGTSNITASFDNISLVTEESAARGISPRKAMNRTPRAFPGRACVRIRGIKREEIRKASIMASNGTRILTCRRFSGTDDASFALNSTIAPGAYLLHVDLCNGGSSVLPLVLR